MSDEMNRPPEEDSADPQVCFPAQDDVPLGETQPVPQNDPVLGAIKSLGIGAVVVGFLLAPTVMSGPTRGATRSAKLEWQKRQQQIEQAIAEEAVPPAQTTHEAETDVDG